MAKVFAIAFYSFVNKLPPTYGGRRKAGLKAPQRVVQKGLPLTLLAQLAYRIGQSFSAGI